jgi:hypothetical protein
VIPFAHTGHVIVDLLTLFPILVLAVWFIVMAVRSRGRDDRETGAGE